MKPADAEQTVSASLVGGTTEDKYGFSWYADNYNVIDLTYQANTAVISPKQEGTATITITHPKAAYDGKMTVRVTEYSVFAFSQTSMTTMEGTTQFISLLVPAMDGAYSGSITYTTDNAKIVTVTGTNKVAQITAVASGTAIVSATSPSGAKSEMMVYVQKAAEAAKPYITSTSSVLSMKVGDGQRSVSASLVGQGVVQTDQYNLKWAVDNPGVASLTGTTGTNVLIKAVNAGETTVRITHEKTDTVFTLYIQVEGLTKGLMLNKNYGAIETGKTVELSATITGGTSDDYKQISWSAEKVNNQEIVTILGSGKTVAVYGVNPGQAKVTAEFNGNSDTCDVVVQAARQFSFDTQTMRIQPGQTKTFSYTLVPEDAAINWITTSNDYISYSVNTSAKTVSVTGVSDGNNDSGVVTRLSGTAQSLSASITITCAWDYRFSLGKSLIQGDPRADPAQSDKFVIPYEVNPPNAKIEVQSTRDIVSWTIDTAGRKITLTPKGEGEATLMVTAVNAANGAKFSTQNCALNLAYSSLTLQPSQVSVNGRFSRYDGESGTVVLGDGEELNLRLSVAEINTNYTLNNVTFTNTSGSTPAITLDDSRRADGIWGIKHPKDHQEYDYTVYHDIDFYYKGSLINNKFILLGETLKSWKLETFGVDWFGTVTEQYYVINTGITEIRQVQNFLRSENRIVYENGSSGATTKTFYFYSWDNYESEIYLVVRGINDIVTAAKIRRRIASNTDSEYFLMAGVEDEAVSPNSVENVTLARRVITPKIVEKSVFEGNPRYYAKLPNGTGFNINDTTRYEVSPDTAVQSSTVAGYLKGSIAHNGTNQAFQIPVILETRRCLSGSTFSNTN
jgi:hypothetical protein